MAKRISFRDVHARMLGPKLKVPLTDVTSVRRYNALRKYWGFSDNEASIISRTDYALYGDFLRGIHGRRKKVMQLCKERRISWDAARHLYTRLNPDKVVDDVYDLLDET